jgi:hypothetical protein
MQPILGRPIAVPGRDQGLAPQPQAARKGWAASAAQRCVVASTAHALGGRNLRAQQRSRAPRARTGLQSLSLALLHWRSGRQGGGAPSLHVRWSLPWRLCLHMRGCSP